ncbi:MAG: YicC family protein [Deltaproteobacteria bacterium]|nr:YicC family protein [Deltaproteobacteria bacterium]
MRSMTGFGLGEAPLGDGRVAVEARSVNHRVLDVRVNAPPELGAHLGYLEQLARGRLRRGRYDIGVRLVGATVAPVALELERARAIFAALCRLRDELAPDAAVPLAALAAFPDLLRPSGVAEPEGVREALGAALGRALDALDAMRAREGEALARALREHLAEARRLCAQIEARRPALVEAMRTRLRERLGRLLEGVDVTVDAGRLELELAVLADRSDVSEELARLGSHFEQFAGLLGADEPVGRTLDFLLQEMMREASTAVAKCPDAAVAQRGVELKSALERLREQVQNVE